MIFKVEVSHVPDRDTFEREVSYTVLEIEAKEVSEAFRIARETVERTGVVVSGLRLLNA